jgi:hypothetical protein
MLERQALNGVARSGLFLVGRRSLPMSIIAGPAYAGELAHAFDSNLALRP